MAKYQSVRGMKDVLPEETRQWVWIENQARRNITIAKANCLFFVLLISE